MQLTRHLPDDEFWIQSVTDDAIRVNDQPFSESLLITPWRPPTAWAVVSSEALQPADLDPILELEPDVVLLATGRRQRFPSHAFQYRLLERHIGLEVMNIEAAARTYNVLAGEQRRVVAAIIWE